MNPGTYIGTSERLSIHARTSYAFDFIGGVEGESVQVFTLGPQLRYALNASDPYGRFVGAETLFARRRTTFDNDFDDTDITNGYFIGVIGGVPVTDFDRRGLSLTVGTGLVKYGGSGPYFRLGLQFRPSRGSGGARYPRRGRG